MTPTEYNIESKKYERPAPSREAVFHAIVGLCGETGEFLTADVSKKVEEAGDVFWYLFCLDRALGKYTSHRSVLSEFDPTAEYNPPRGLLGVGLGMQVLLLAECVKKSMYARRPLVLPSTDVTLAPRLLHFAHTLVEMVGEGLSDAGLVLPDGAGVTGPDVSLSYIFKGNIEKLTRRMAGVDV